MTLNAINGIVSVIANKTTQLVLYGLTLLLQFKL